MIRELYFIAIAKMMRPQVGAQRILRRLGFREGTIIPNYVKDLAGEAQDLIVLTIDTDELWKELERFFDASDWQRTR